SGLDPAERAARLSAEARRPFDLETGPVFRARLFTSVDGDPLVLMVIHHIVSDFWSIAVLMTELGQIYRAVVAGTEAEAELPRLEIQVTDCARWQADHLAGPEGERLWAYWREQLSGSSTVLNLPTDRTRPTVQTDRGASRSLRLDRALTQRLAALGAAHGSSL